MQSLPGKWTDERIEQLKQLHGQGLSAQLIADNLGGFERSKDNGRNAIIGKLHRLGIAMGKPSIHKNLGKPHGPNYRARNIRAKRAAGIPIPIKSKPVEIIAPPAPVVADHDIPLSQRMTILQIDGDHCKWPVGERPYFFCGAPAPDGVYCAAHTRRSIQKYQQAATITGNPV